MSDPYNVPHSEDPQSQKVVTGAREQKNLRDNSFNEDKKDNPQNNVSALYDEGIKWFRQLGYRVVLSESGDHVHHRILFPKKPPEVKGISYPGRFLPLQDISTIDEYKQIETAQGTMDTELRTFWEPLVRPKAGDTDLKMVSERMLRLKNMERTKNSYETLDYNHSFDPLGKIHGGSMVTNPNIWVPAREWFDPKVQKVRFEDVFTIFPKAEQELLKLLLGRVGVGRANHLPPGWKIPVEHTARMAAVVVGKDAGLGKSTCFNSMNAALSKCGYTTHTFKKTDDRFGLKTAALADVAYKDDTSMKSLRGFLSSEETKILVTGGIFQTEEKFMNSEQIWPKCVLLVNSNDWDANFAYDLDPGIIDRIKILSTLREAEVIKLRDRIGGVSQGSPDLRPHSHLKWLANSLNVDVDVLFLWCLRIATDRFWEIISDHSDPTVNRLQVEVRKWTTRQRIKFKADATQAIVNAMSMASAIKRGADDYDMPEMTPRVLLDHLQDFHFVGTDPSCVYVMDEMKALWEAEGRISAHFYQGFRDIRWETLEIAIREMKDALEKQETSSAGDIIKAGMGKINLRDGFKISNSLVHLNENWQHTKFGEEETKKTARSLVETMDPKDKEYTTTTDNRPFTKWMDKKYSPEKAEGLRIAARDNPEWGAYKLFQKA